MRVAPAYTASGCVLLPARSSNRETPLCVRGVYLLLIGSQPAEKTILVDLPPIQVWVTLSGCTPTSPENLCPEIPSLLLTGEEPLPNEHITAIYAVHRWANLPV